MKYALYSVAGVRTKHQGLQADGLHLVYPSRHDSHLLNVTNLSTDKIVTLFKVTVVVLDAAKKKSCLSENSNKPHQSAASSD